MIKKYHTIYIDMHQYCFHKIKLFWWLHTITIFVFLCPWIFSMNETSSALALSFCSRSSKLTSLFQMEQCWAWKLNWLQHRITGAFVGPSIKNQKKLLSYFWQFIRRTVHKFVNLRKIEHLKIWMTSWGWAEPGSAIAGVGIWISQISCIRKINCGKI